MIVSFLVFLVSLIIVVPTNYFDKETDNLSKYLFSLQHPNSDKIDKNEREYLKYVYKGQDLLSLKNEYIKDFRLYILFEILNFLFIA